MQKGVQMGIISFCSIVMSAYFDTAQIMPFLPVVLGIVILILVAFIVWVIFLNKRITRLLGGSNARTIEDATKLASERLVELEKFQAETIRYLRVMEARIRRSIQTSETIRFNPFKGSGAGGNQSFATTLINENGDGVVLSSLYSRDRISVFSKPIKDFKPVYDLSEEEKEALDMASKKIRNR